MTKIKIISVVGTRPNFIKVAPLCRAFSAHSDRVEHLLCHTGQHSDATMSDVFFRDLGMPNSDFFLGINNGTHGEITGRIMIEFEKILMKERPELVIVVGDVNSTMACALAAVKLGIKVAHVEAGLRSRDRTMPEEINRIITDSISDYLFVTEKTGVENLRNEGIPSEKVFFTGNVMIDSLMFLQYKISASSIQDQLGLKKGEYILVTFHRPSNVDTEENLLSLIQFLNDLSGELPVLFPIHPRTLKNLKAFGLTDNVKPGVHLIEPLGYLDFQNLVRHARIVVTDSGGIQEETTFLGVQCLTVRDNTERPVTIEVGTNQLCGTDLDQVSSMANEILAGTIKEGKIPELWDGKAANRITEILVTRVIPSK
ncbi:MAG: UDP-N-acetylglucosamine 2-epimerase (non-hydrolyzing) [Bacteroidia bacterium]|nr:UDP-N-acetylglucosamine 2-epimerase (non-hydrolyzing) [Bacteroidia bacterium]